MTDTMVSKEGLWPNLVSYISGTRTGPDSHGIFRLLHYPSFDFLDE